LAAGAGAGWFPILGRFTATPAIGRAALPHLAGFEVAWPHPDWKPLFFDQHQNGRVIVLSELIIPATDTPGAKAALVIRYIDWVLSEETADNQRSFIEGLAWIDGRSLKLHGLPFVKLSAEQQTALLALVADPNNHNPEDQRGGAFFEQMKGWSILGYYTAKIGLEQELQYGGDNDHTEYPGACTHPEHQS
jgi:hypothetical protein